MAISFFKKNKDGIIVGVLVGVLVGVFLGILKLLGLSLLHLLTIFFTTRLTCPLWFIVLLSGLSAYTAFVFIRSIMIARATKPFEHNGFLWKSSWWPWDPPYPVCKTCGEPLTSQQSILIDGFSSRYNFTCGDSRHDSFGSTVTPQALQREAMKVRKKIREEQKKQPRTWFRKSA